MSVITVREVQIAQSGRNQIATVLYTSSRGEDKQKKVVSFANPAVFSTAKNAKAGEQYEVSFKEGDQYYNWISMVPVGDDAPTRPAPVVNTSGPTISKSTYETADERKIKQLYIIKQSSISSAVELLSVNPGKEKIQVEDVLNIAQRFVDFVYDNGVDDSTANMAE